MSWTAEADIKLEAAETVQHAFERAQRCPVATVLLSLLLCFLCRLSGMHKMPGKQLRQQSRPRRLPGMRGGSAPAVPLLLRLAYGSDLPGTHTMAVLQSQNNFLCPGIIAAADIRAHGNAQTEAHDGL